MKLTYVAMPYSHGDKAVVKDRMEQFYKFSSKLLLEGKMVISPVLNHPICVKHDVPSDYKFWKEYSRTLISKCDELIVLELHEWWLSIGVNDEICYAHSLHIPVTYVNI